MPKDWGLAREKCLVVMGGVAISPNKSIIYSVLSNEFSQRCDGRAAHKKRNGSAGAVRSGAKAEEEERDSENSILLLGKYLDYSIGAIIEGFREDQDITF